MIDLVVLLFYEVETPTGRTVKTRLLMTPRVQVIGFQPPRRLTSLSYRFSFDGYSAELVLSTAHEHFDQHVAVGAAWDTVLLGLGPSCHHRWINLNSVRAF